MCKFAKSYPDVEFVQQAAAQLPLFDIAKIMDKVKEKYIQNFYMKHAIEHGWSRNIMVMQIKKSLHKRQGKAVTNFKDKDFKPEYAGKMNFYLSAVDDFVKHETDHPSIGLILCKIQNNVLTKYTLRDIKKPIGLDEYRLEDSLPDARHTSIYRKAGASDIFRCVI